MIRINVLAIRLKGSKSVENNKGLFSDSAQDHTEVERILKLGEDESSSMEVKDEASLYDKLVYSLISESLMTHSDNIMTDDCDVCIELKGIGVHARTSLQFRNLAITEDCSIR
ncbi:hypothetical protein TNCV_1060031 [Trichonephila clavipes]|nr:hypothetical protein TNCV_1060031 [Trichonephila clavipes]